VRPAVVLGAGGERVVAWETGVLAGLADAGVDLSGPVLGTSAGAAVGARLALGADPRADADRLAAHPGDRRGGPSIAAAALFARLADAYSRPATAAERGRRLGRLALIESPGGEDGFVAAQASRVGDGPWPERLRVVTIEAETGRRLLLDAKSHVPLARAVAASRAIPALCPPVTIAGRPCVDGGLGSPTNADLMVDGEVVIVAAPPAVGPERGWLAHVHREAAALRARGQRVIVIEPGPRDLAAMGRDPMRGAPRAAEAGRETGLLALSAAAAA
jgi:NTE family protein